MKSSLVLPVVLVTAASAFGVGWYVRPILNDDPGSKASASTERGARTAESVDLRAKSASTAKDPAFAEKGNGLIISSLSGTDVKKSLLAALQENDSLKSNALFAELLAGLNADNIEEAVQAMRDAPRSFRNGDKMRLLMYAWGQIDGQKAMDYIKAQEGEGGDRGRGGRGGWGSGMDSMSVLSGWASGDPKAAIGYYNELENGREKMMSAFGLVNGLMTNDLSAATDFVASMEAEGGDRSRLMGMIATEMLEQGTSAAASWASSLTDPDLQSGALSRVADQYAREDLQGAMRWVEGLAGSESSERAVAQIAEQFSRENPKGAAEWVLGLEGAGERAISTAFDQWTEQDPDAVAGYLDQMEDGASRDSAVSGFANEVVRDDPEGAVAWAQTITNEETRNETIQQVASRWYRSDREAAQAWMTQNNIPAEQQQAITTARPDWGGRGGDRGGRGGGGGGAQGGGGR